MKDERKTPKPPTASGPTPSGKRFLVKILEHAFREGWRTPEDFLRRFPADAILKALANATELRVALLSAATGMHEGILRRKRPALAAEDLRMALEEGMTSPERLLEVFTTEDQVRYLNPHELWDFLAADQFWVFDETATAELRKSAAERMTFTLARALDERLISLRDVLDGMTYETVVEALPPADLRKVVRHALVKGRDGIGLNEKALLEVVPLGKLVRSLSLEQIWSEVVIRRLAVPSGLTDLRREERRNSQHARASGSMAPPPPPVGRSSVVPPVAPRPMVAPPGPPPAPPSFPPAASTQPPSRDLRHSPRALAALTDEDDEQTTAIPPEVAAVGHALKAPPLPTGLGDPTRSGVPAPPPPSSLGSSAVASSPPSAAPGGESDAQIRGQISDRLQHIGRLPPNHQSLATPVLRSIDAMYSLLPNAADDMQRRSVIRQAFSNEQHLRSALLGLIALMDATVDTSDPVIQGAKVDALIKILLFEEQRRKEPLSQQPPAYRGSSAPPAGASSPPPHPGSGQYSGSPSQYPGSGHHSPSQYPGPDQYSSSSSHYPGPPSHAPLPNLPAQPRPNDGRSVPPPLPSSFPPK